MDGKVIELHSEADTALVAEKLANIVIDQKMYNLKIYLSGELGAGKTTFSKYFLRALGVIETIKSPTYTIIESYVAREFSIDHIDLYRIEEYELHDLGFLEDDDKLWLIEWPEKGGGSLPQADLLLSLQRNVDLTITLLPKTELGQQVVSQFC